MHLHNPSDNPPATSLPLLFSIMARTSRDPFSPLSSSMKNKVGRGQKKVAGVSAKADGSAGTPKKKTTTSAKQTKKKKPPELSELSDIEESPPINQRKPPPEGIMPSLVPHTRRNTARATRKGLPNPPASIYLPPVEDNDQFVPSLPPFDGDIQPLNHTSPHKYPPASFVAAAACAASPANTLEDNDDAFNDLVGEVLAIQVTKTTRTTLTTWRRQLAR